MNDIQAVITLEEAKVSCNFEQVEQAIQERLEEYKGAVFTEQSRTYAKKVVASLRAEKKSLQENMRDAKKRYMKPWDDFEAQVEKLITIYDEPIDLINSQIQAFEERRIEEKRKCIRKIYAETVPDETAAWLSLDQIYDRRWENATAKEGEIRRQITEICEKIRKETAMICGTGSEAVERALSMYRTDFDLTKAMSYINSYERQKQEILTKEQERQRLEEEERVRRQEREKLLAEQRTKEELDAAVGQAKEEAAQEVINSFIPDDDGGTELYEYRIALSADAKRKLEMFMDSVGIEWETI